MLRKLFMRHITIYYSIILAVIILDQVTKYIIRTTMVLGQSIPVIEDVFHITYFRNTGAAFGILQDQTTLLTVLPIFLIAGLLIFLTSKTKGSHFTLPLAIALISSGGIGNLIDRISFGAVIDFFDFRVFPIFNIADSCVVIGCSLLLIHMFFFDKDDKAEATDELESSEEVEASDELESSEEAEADDEPANCEEMKDEEANESAGDTKAGAELENSKDIEDENESESPENKKGETISEKHEDAEDDD